MCIIGGILKKTLTLLSLLTIISGCNGGGGGSSSNIPTPDPVIENNRVLEGHVGLWGECVADTATTSMFRMYNISSNSLIASFAYYSSLNCQSSNIQFEDRIVYDLSRIGDKHQTNIVGSSSRSVSTSDVSYNNTNSYCGYSDWTLNNAKDTLNRDCEGRTNTTGPGPDISFSKNGVNLILSVGLTNITLNAFHTPVFGHNGTAPTNGSYVFYHDEIAHVITINSGSYNLHQANPRTLEYRMESGSYSISGDIVTLTQNSETPNCGNIGSVKSFQYSPSPLVLIFRDGESLVTAESFDWTPTYFAEAFVGKMTTLGCF